MKLFRVVSLFILKGDGCHAQTQARVEGYERQWFPTQQNPTKLLRIQLLLLLLFFLLGVKPLMLETIW